MHVFGFLGKAKETRQFLSARAVEQFDYEYQRDGGRNLFLLCQLKRGLRHLEVTEQRTMLDFAQQMKWLVDVGFLKQSG